VRPSWRYSELVADRVARVAEALDLQSGGGEALARLDRLAPFTVVAEAWGPNIPIAGGRLRPRGVHVVAADTDEPSFPFADASFELVTSRHPVTTCWREIARVLEPGGTFLSQQVGPNSVSELRGFLTGEPPGASLRDPDLACREATDAGLEVIDLQVERLRTVFSDVGAIVYFLRLVVWIIEDFTPDRYRERLLTLHERIAREGPFVTYAARFLIEARKAA
jgi:SAM-dependent methyltransferase